MKRFIPLSVFQKLYNSYSELLSSDGLSIFLERVKGEEGESIRKKALYEPEEFAYFIKTVSKIENVLFYNWIEQNNTLFAFLRENKLDLFEDNEGHLQHKFGNEYKKFVSPFLSNQLLGHQNEKELSELVKVFSFVQLLDDEHRSVVENHLAKELMADVKNVTSNTRIINDEQTLVDRVKPLMDDRILTIVNSLSKASYGFKVGYVDDCLSVLKTKSCTPRFANWVLKKLEGIKLNEEHEHKVVDLRNELVSGDISVRNHGKRKVNFRFGTSLTFLFIIGLAGLVSYVVYYKPFSDIENTQFTNDTSFMQFSKEERLRIDSLLVSMNGNKGEDDLGMDQGIPLIGDRDELTIRKSFNNPTLERMYKDLITDAEYREDLYQDSCNQAVKFQLIPGSSNLEKRRANIETMIKNESEYDAMIIVSENRTNGKTYSMILLKGETKNFEINKYNYLKVIPGNNLQNYVSLNDDNIDEPSEKFKQHFCDIDFNYRDAINTDYQMLNQTEGRTKILLMGDKGGSFKVIDINGVFETD